MSHTHEFEIEKDSRRRQLAAKVDTLRALTCPFCKEKELFVYPPSDIDPELPLWMNRRWWTVGCQSRACDSSWRIEKDYYREVHNMLLHCQPPEDPTQTGNVMRDPVRLLSLYGATYEDPGYIGIDFRVRNYVFGATNGNYTGNFGLRNEPGVRYGVAIRDLPLTATAEELALWICRAISINPNLP
jgi:hypothetical protein